MAEQDHKQEYIDAYERWQRDLTKLHGVLLNGQPLDPMHRIALLRSESHTHDRYEQARQRFLGIGSESTDSPFDETENEHA